MIIPIPSRDRQRHPSHAKYPYMVTHMTGSFNFQTQQIVYVPLFLYSYNLLLASILARSVGLSLI